MSINPQSIPCPHCKQGYTTDTLTINNTTKTVKVRCNVCHAKGMLDRADIASDLYVRFAFMDHERGVTA